MSKSHIAEITCPKCHSNGEFEVWDSINADLHPDLKDKLFSNDLFVYTCPICGAHIEICYGTLYHDRDDYFRAVDKFCTFCEVAIPKRGERIIEKLKTIIN